MAMIRPSNAGRNRVSIHFCIAAAAGLSLRSSWRVPFSNSIIVIAEAKSVLGIWLATHSKSGSSARAGSCPRSAQITSVSSRYMGSGLSWPRAGGSPVRLHGDRLRRRQQIGQRIGFADQMAVSLDAQQDVRRLAAIGHEDGFVDCDSLRFADVLVEFAAAEALQSDPLFDRALLLFQADICRYVTTSWHTRNRISGRGGIRR